MAPSPEILLVWSLPRTSLLRQSYSLCPGLPGPFPSLALALGVLASLTCCQVTRRQESGSHHWTMISLRLFNSVAQSCPTLMTPRTAAHQGSLSITNFWSLLKLMSTESVMPSNHLILCHPLLLLPSVFPSIRVFSNESVLHIRWPKYWSFSFSISPSNEHTGLISFRMDWLDLLAVQGTLKSPLQRYN